MLPTLFNYEGQELRTITKDCEPWFVAMDVCGILGLGNTSQAISRLDDDEVRDLISNDTTGRPQNMSWVNEPGLYSLILGSRKPEAKAFKRWITHDVLPSIHKTGSYSVNPQLQLPKIAKLVKAKHDLFLLSGISKRLAYSKALSSVELETGVDLSEFKPDPQ